MVLLPNLHGAGGWACAGAAQSPLGGVGRLRMLLLRRGWRVGSLFFACGFDLPVPGQRDFCGAIHAGTATICG